MNARLEDAQLGDLVLDFARAAPSQVAVWEPAHGGWQATRADELADLVARAAVGLERAGLRRGDLVCVFVRPGRDWIAILYALFRLGAVPVAIDPGMGRTNLLACVERIGPRGFIGIPAAHALRLTHARAFRSIEVNVTVGAPKLWSGHSFERLLRASGAAGAGSAGGRTEARDLAAILFTSGATGPPKGVRYSHGMFRAQLSALRKLYGFRPGEIDLACFPLFALFAPAFGWTAVLPRMDFSRPATCDPRDIVEACHRFAPSNTFASPAVWRKVAPYCRAQGEKLTSIQRLLIAGAPVEPRLLEACQGLLDAGSVHTPYGATEALPVASASARDLLGDLRVRTEAGEGICVGRPVQDATIKLVRVTDGAIPTWNDELEVGPGQIGEICVSGAWVTREYAFDDAATMQAKIQGAPGSGHLFWHRMGDLGRLDSAGLLWFLGRKAHRLETTRGLLPPIGVENVFRSRSGIEQCALVGVGPRGRERPYLIAVMPRGKKPRGTGAARNSAAAILAGSQAHPEASRVEGVLFRDSLPVDVRHNAKIDRLALKSWAEERVP